MFRKVHLRLTLLCAGITAAIMIIMSLCYLYVSEQGLYRNQFQSFKNDINTITTNLEQQSVISMEWLSKMEAQGNYTFFLLDNQIPFLYNSLGSPDEKGLLLKECLAKYNKTISITDSDEKRDLSPYTSCHVEFELTSSAGRAYYCSVITFERSSSILQVIVLSSLDKLGRQILEQRLLFIFINLIVCLLLVGFSFLFTGKLLKPIMENQQKQIQFIASASHELRTPLAVILSSAECCKSSNPEEQKIFLNTIHSEGLRMGCLIDDMLTLSCSDNHQFSVDPEPVEMDTLILSSYEAFEPLARERSLALSVELPDRALPCCTCDKNRIRQVISILLSNALSYTPSGGHVKLSLACEKEIFSFSVADNGIGISDEEKKRIFDRFYRAEKARSTKGHFGLGLSIAYEIVKSHHGSLSVSDAPGGGAIFTVKLPVL